MNVNGVDTDAKLDSTNRNHKHNFDLSVFTIFTQTRKKLRSRIDQMEPLNSYELLEIGI